MTLDEYNELLLQDELKIGYGIPEDEFTDEFDEDSYIDGLLTDGMSEYDDRQTGTFDVDASEMFGEEVSVILYTNLIIGWLTLTTLPIIINTLQPLNYYA